MEPGAAPVVVGIPATALISSRVAPVGLSTSEGRFAPSLSWLAMVRAWTVTCFNVVAPYRCWLPTRTTLPAVSSIP